MDQKYFVVARQEKPHWIVQNSYYKANKLCIGLPSHHQNRKQAKTDSPSRYSSDNPRNTDCKYQFSSQNGGATGKTKN